MTRRPETSLGSVLVAALMLVVFTVAGAAGVGFYVGLVVAAFRYGYEALR